MRLAWTALFLASALFSFEGGAAAAATAPQPKSDLDRWFADLAKADSPEDAKPIETKIETAFKQSGSASVDLLMSRAKEALNAADSKTAGTILAAVTKLAPDYAE